MPAAALLKKVLLCKDSIAEPSEHQKAHNGDRRHHWEGKTASAFSHGLSNIEGKQASFFCG